jgi:hypothetical protein
MEQTGFLLLVLAALPALLFRRWMLDALIEAIDDIANNFRGGPPTAMHPSPANDAGLLRKRRRTIEN